MNTANHDLRSFVAQLRDQGELATVDVPVDPHLEIAAITDRTSKARGPALAFTRPLGYDATILTNLFGSPQRAARALAGDPADLETTVDRLRRDLAAAGPGPAEERLRRLCALQPPVAGRAAWDECAGDLNDIPALHSWPGDGGRYLTLAIVVTSDPAGGEVNYGLYRVQLLDRERALIAWRPGSGGGLHYELWRREGRAMPVSIVLGAPPALLWAASAPLPSALDEAAAVGYLTGRPLALASGRANPLPVPACAEALLEGTVAPDATGIEGPFGNHTGAYRPPTPAPLFRLAALRRRRDALYPCTVVGPPPMEDIDLAEVTARLFLPILQCDLPDLIDLSMPRETIFHACAFAAWRDPVADPRDILAALQQSPLLRSARLIVICDAETDVHAMPEVFWKAINRASPERDLIPLPRGGGIGLDIRRTPLRSLTHDRTTLDLLSRRWSEYGLPKL